MAIRKFVSVKEVIGMVYTYYRDDVEIQQRDLIEFIDDGLNLIGVKGQFEDLTAQVPIANHRGLLPCGFIEEIQLADPWGMPMLYNTTTIIEGTSQENTDSYIAGEQVNEDNVALIAVPPVSGNRQRYYINKNCIYTSFEEGTLTMNFVGIRVDEEGYPLIPDLEEFKQALMWWVLKAIFTRKWLNGGTNLENIISNAESKWIQYRRMALDQANMPTLTELENIKTNWVRLVPRMNEFSKFFSDIANPERRYNNP
jgi:hypothetical protein